MIKMNASGRIEEIRKFAELNVAGSSSSCSESSADSFMDLGLEFLSLN